MSKLAKVAAGVSSAGFVLGVGSTLGCLLANRLENRAKFRKGMLVGFCAWVGGGAVLSGARSYNEETGVSNKDDQ